MSFFTTEKSRVLLVGGGGIGTLTALALEQGGCTSVTIVLRSNYDVVKEKGFCITSSDHGILQGWRPTAIVRTVPEVEAHDEKDSRPFDYIICTTKNIPEVEPGLVELIKPAVTRGRTTIVLIQNGLNIQRPIVEAFPNNICLSGVSLMDANEVTTGQIVQDSSDRLIVGPFPSETLDNEKQEDAAREFVRMYSACGKVQCSFDSSVMFVRWRKLMYNAVWNPVCALTDLDTSRIRFAAIGQTHVSPLDLLIRPAMEEIRAAARAAHDIQLPESLIETTVNVDPIQNFCVPSMLQDRRKKKFLECEFLIGEALREGESAGVQMPIVKTLYGLCKAAQWHALEATGRVDVKGLLDQSLARDECGRSQPWQLP